MVNQAGRRPQLDQFISKSGSLFFAEILSRFLRPDVLVLAFSHRPIFSPYTEFEPALQPFVLAFFDETR
jgi:hypothetical protein